MQDKRRYAVSCMFADYFRRTEIVTANDAGEAAGMAIKAADSTDEWKSAGLCAATFVDSIAKTDSDDPYEEGRQCAIAWPFTEAGTNKHSATNTTVLKKKTMHGPARDGTEHEGTLRNLLRSLLERAFGSEGGPIPYQDIRYQIEAAAKVYDTGCMALTARLPGHELYAILPWSEDPEYTKSMTSQVTRTAFSTGLQLTALAAAWSLAERGDGEPEDEWFKEADKRLIERYVKGANENGAQGATLDTLPPIWRKSGEHARKHLRMKLEQALAERLDPDPEKTQAERITIMRCAVEWLISQNYQDNNEKNARAWFEEDLTEEQADAIEIQSELTEEELKRALSTNRAKRISESTHLEEHPMWKLLKTEERENARKSAVVWEKTHEASSIAYNINGIRDGKPLTTDERRELAREILVTQVRMLVSQEPAADNIIRIGPSSDPIHERMEELKEPWRMLVAEALKSMDGFGKPDKITWSTVHAN